MVTTSCILLHGISCVCVCVTPIHPHVAASWCGGYHPFAQRGWWCMVDYYHYNVHIIITTVIIVNYYYIVMLLLLTAWATLLTGLASPASSSPRASRGWFAYVLLCVGSLLLWCCLCHFVCLIVLIVWFEWLVTLLGLCVSSLRRRAMLILSVPFRCWRMALGRESVAGKSVWIIWLPDSLSLSFSFPSQWPDPHGWDPLEACPNPVTVLCWCYFLGALLVTPCLPLTARTLLAFPARCLHFPLNCDLERIPSLTAALSLSLSLSLCLYLEMFELRRNGGNKGDGGIKGGSTRAGSGWTAAPGMGAPSTPWPGAPFSARHGHCYAQSPY